MKIVHICLASSFTEYMSYQDNLLPYQNKIDGHTVTVISNCNKFLDGKIVFTEPEERILDSGIMLIRLKYDNVINPYISEKVRKVKGLYKLLCELEPDVILFHGLAGWELLTAAKYKRKHPKIKLYVDSHEDAHNSATNFLSKQILHKVFYKTIIKKCIPYIDIVLYVSMEVLDFIVDIYRIPKDKIEFYPLGGTIIEEESVLRIETK